MEDKAKAVYFARGLARIFLEVAQFLAHFAQLTHEFGDLGALVRLLDSARGAIPPELARQLADALRDLLIALRAIIDWSIARLESDGPDEPRVEDIPIQ